MNSSVFSFDDGAIGVGVDFDDENGTCWLLVIASLMVTGDFTGGGGKGILAWWLNFIEGDLLLLKVLCFRLLVLFVVPYSSSDKSLISLSLSLLTELTLLLLTGGDKTDCLDFLLDELGVTLVIFTFTGGGGGGGGPII